MPTKLQELPIPEEDKRTVRLFKVTGAVDLMSATQADGLPKLNHPYRKETPNVVCVRVICKPLENRGEYILEFLYDDKVA